RREEPGPERVPGPDRVDDRDRRELDRGGIGPATDDPEATRPVRHQAEAGGAVDEVRPREQRWPAGPKPLEIIEADLDDVRPAEDLVHALPVAVLVRDRRRSHVR